MRLDAPVTDASSDRRIQVIGVAVLTTIVFLAGGRATEKYYYQTHVRVTADPQIRFQAEGWLYSNPSQRTDLRHSNFLQGAAS